MFRARGRGCPSLATVVVLAIALTLGFTRPCTGYSVVMHQAIIDAEWDAQIRPFLLARFPHATPEVLRLAKSYAYGGSLIQDMGYYPFADRLSSQLTHYVRSGDFVQALFANSRNINDYAFSLGALSHYCADIEGHSLGVNRSVPLLYPRLRAKYGDVMTWEDSPSAHIITEFGFDTLEVVAGHVAPPKYHQWIGFRVDRPMLERAYRQTYGLELSHLGLCIFMYRKTASWLVPQMTQVAWALKEKTLEQRATSLHHRNLFHLRDETNYQAWESTRKRPGAGYKVAAFVFRIFPKVGPLDVLKFHPPTEETEQLIADSLEATIADYRGKIKRFQSDPPDINLDTGLHTRPGDYRYCDRAFAQLLHRLEERHFATVTPEIRASLLNFYRDSEQNTVQKNPRQWRRVMHDLQQLKAAPPSPPAREIAQR